MHNDRKNYRIYTLPEQKYKSNKLHNVLATLIYLVLSASVLFYIVSILI